MDLNKFLGIFIVYITLLSSKVYCEDVCTAKSSCICVFPNGTGIDLTPASKSNFLSTQMYEELNNGAEYRLSTYNYHPCYDTMYKTNTTINNTCIGPLSICRHVNLMKREVNNTFTIDNGAFDFMGSSNDSKFSSDGRSIIYMNGPSKTIMLLICADTDDEIHVQSLMEPNEVMLSFYSRFACLKQLEISGRSLGSTLCIIFLSLVIFYLVLGICTKKFLMGATGIEVIPNLGFWSDLPNLVREGALFTANGFKLPPRGAGPTTSPDPNSYDSI